MSNQGETPLTRRGKVIAAVGVAVVAAVIATVGIGIGTAAHAAQVKAAAEKAMTAAAPAYDSAITLGGDLTDLSVKSAEAKKAYDAEQERLAAEKAAQEAAAAAAAQAAAEAAAQQAAAEEAARQQAAQDAASDDSAGNDTGSTPPVPSSGKLPSGSPVPWIPNPDPQDSAGGRWDTSACASGSASGNPAICD
jgi:hypothetical protein